MEPLIELDRDSRHSGVITVDGKSYVLQDYDGSITVKGATLSGRNLEPYNRNFIRHTIDCIFDDNIEGIVEYYNSIHFLITSYMLPIDDIATRSTLNQSLEEYQHKLNSKSGTRSAPYEIALKSDRKYRKGDVIAYYIKEPPLVEKTYKTRPPKMVPMNMKAYEKATPISKYDFDMDRDHYLSRLDKTAIKFIGVIGFDKFKKLFPDIKLNKEARRKMIPVWGLDKFLERFPKYGWSLKDVHKLSEEDQQQFKIQFKDKYKWIDEI